MARRGPGADPAAEAAAGAWAKIRAHPLFRPMCSWNTPVRAKEASQCPPEGWAVLDGHGRLHLHPTRRASEAEWVWVMTHLLVHQGLDHLDETGLRGDEYDRAAACVVVDRFLAALRLGSPPQPLPVMPGGDERSLAAQWRGAGQIPPEHQGHSVGGSTGCALPRGRWVRWNTRHPELFAAGLAAAATAAVELAGGVRSSLTDASPKKQVWEQALRWFTSSYPLLGALASGLTLVADAELARSWDIRVAAVSAEAGEIYVNPLAGHSVEEWKFILAHEMLHAALRHDARGLGRDPYLFNVAADYALNSWLVEMGVGEMPDGLLYDPELRGLSAEAIYDRITTDLRRARKLLTLRGTHTHREDAGDILSRRLPRPGEAVDAVDLESFYRGALSQGLVYHEQAGRGLLPAGLIEEIRALDHPPLRWDAQLAAWFEEHVPAQERRRSYARPSRRQSATPEIPRAGWYWPEDRVSQSTFGVVLDTSGSMERKLLGQALGAIASYAASRDVPACRLVCCDAQAYDLGYVPVDEIAERMRLRGRGGTVLQPGVNLLERAEDFPPTGPILVITDGYIDVVRIKREHAFLIPAGASLPFTPRGPVFRVSE